MRQREERENIVGETAVSKKFDMKKFFKENWSTVLMTVFVAVFALTLLLGLWKPVIVHQTSMYPTLEPKDYLFIVRTEDYDRGDIVVFSDETVGQENLVKRIIGVAGDTVEIANGRVWLNGEELQEPYLDSSVVTDGSMVITVSEGCVFLLGDNRPVSIDGRAFGEIPVGSILGEAKLRLFHKITLF